jgi:hypothetical protein
VMAERLLLFLVMAVTETMVAILLLLDKLR